MNPVNVSERKPVIRIQAGAIARLAAVSLVFNFAVVGVLLFILLDLAPRNGLTRGREYEALRIALELLALTFSGSLILWAVFYRRTKPID